MVQSARTMSSIKKQANPVKDNRPSAHKRGYGSRWKKVRHNYLTKNPLCVICLEKGKTVMAKVVDHKIAHKGRYTLMWDESNFQALCVVCHNRKTATEDGGFGHKIKEIA